MPLRLLPIFFLWLITASPAWAALEIGKPLWGFGGTAVKGVFNPLSVEIHNAGGKAFDGEIALTGGAVPVVQPVFLAPGGTRVVQFFPLIEDGYGKWTLQWKDDRENDVELGDFKVGAPAMLILADLSGPAMRGVKMRVFPEELFPPTVSATGGLAAVVLDHAPRWDAVRRGAFLDWVQAGGTVHLVRGVSDELPQFTEELAVLNTAAERTSVGAGLVVQHAAHLAEVSEDWLKAKGFPAPEVHTDGTGGMLDFDGSLFGKLSAVTRPNIAWGLIYGFTAIYIVLVGPVFYRLRKRDYRVLLGGFLLTVAGFAWIFTVVGRRGYGEKQIYHSVAIARSLGGARWAVNEWVHAFATSGDTYRFQHPGGSQLYAVPSKEETVRGKITAGKDGHFDADIPLFSSRPFLHSGVLTGDDCSVEVMAWEMSSNGISGLKRLTLKPGAGFPKKPIRIIAENMKGFYEVELKQDVWTASEASLLPLDKLFPENQNNYGWTYGYGNPDTSKQQLYELAPTLIARAENLPVISQTYISRQAPDADHLRLFIYAEAPAGFRLAGDQFQSGIGYVLYVQDIAKP